MRDLLRPWMLARWPALLAAILVGLATVWAGVGLFTVAGWFLTAAFLAGPSVAFDLFAPSALIRGLSFLRIGSRYAERILGHAATLNLLADLRGAVFAHVMALSPAQLAAYRHGDLVARLTGDVDILDGVFLQWVSPALVACLATLSFGLLVGWHDLLLAGSVCALFLVAAVCVPGWMAWQARARGADLQKDKARLREMVQQTVQAQADILAFGQQALTERQFAERCLKMGESRDHLSGLGALGQLIQQVCLGAALVLLLFLGALAYDRGTITGPIWIGMVLGGIGLFEVLGPLMRAAAQAGMIAEGLRRVGDVLGMAPVMVAPEQPACLPREAALSFEEVSFRHVASERWILRHFNLTIAQGQKIAVVGPSGVGKTTLLALILRIMDPTEGEVRYGRVSLKRADPAQVHSRIAYLEQFSPVFLGTVRDNLLLADPGAADQRLWSVLRQAQLEDFVRSLDQGLDTWVDEAGGTLSVGQARRLCLARILLSPARVWVLDEPTAGLDERTALAFLEVLVAAAGSRTVVVASHARLPRGLFEPVITLQAP